MQFAKSSPLTEKYMSIADAMTAFNSESRLTKTDPDFFKDLIDLPPHAANAPDEGELGYREFLSALVKLAIIEKA